MSIAFAIDEQAVARDRERLRAAGERLNQKIRDRLEAGWPISR
ncbi:MAG: hypothetical protein ACP5FH_09665 [Terracidiphilus sp.]